MDILNLYGLQTQSLGEWHRLIYLSFLHDLSLPEEISVIQFIFNIGVIASVPALIHFLQWILVNDKFKQLCR